MSKRGKSGVLLSKEGMIEVCLSEGEETVDDKQLNKLQELHSEALSYVEHKKVRN